MPFSLTSCQEEPPLRTHSSHRQGAGRIKCQLVLVCFLWASMEPCVQRMLRAMLSTGTETLVGRCLGWRREEDGGGKDNTWPGPALEPYVYVMPLSGVQVRLWDVEGERFNLRFNHIPLQFCDVYGTCKVKNVRTKRDETVCTELQAHTANVPE